MEPENQNLTGAQDPTGLELQYETLTFLTGARKWALFLSILGFIGLGLMIIFSLAFGTILSAMGAQTGFPIPGFLLTVLYIFIALIWFFPLLYLFRFSTNTKKAIDNHDPQNLTTAFMNLKAHYRYIGILLIILMAFYAATFLIIMATGVSSMFGNHM